MPTVRDLVHGIQKAVGHPSDLTPDQAADLLMTASALMGNVADEIRQADAAYATVLLGHLESEQRANRAKIRAEISPEYLRRQEARDTRELLLELIRSLKVFLKCKQDEYRYSGGMQ